jgi:phenylacetate-coenzyme A ligase PaaK-like adenylate-forming protein
MYSEYHLRQDVFNISTESEFNEAAINIFRYQYSNNEIYSKYVNLIGIDADKIKLYRDIPFLPIEFYKTQKILAVDSRQSTDNYTTFISSGTTGSDRSRHYVADINLYEHSLSKCFENFYGNIEDYCFLGLLPSYEERRDSSLIYMVNRFIEKSKYEESGFYLNNFRKLEEIIQNSKLKTQNSKLIIIGLSYALLDFIEFLKSANLQISNSPNLIVMETGGMKGRRKEMVKEELHSILCKAFGVESIHSEYGMTELLSQAYSTGKGIYNCPKWMKVLTRDINDPLTLHTPIPSREGNKGSVTGGINIIDLANVYSCSFIMTNDLGRIYPDNSFEIMGRFDFSDLRGCNMMID